MKTLLGVIIVLIIGTVAIWAISKTSQPELTLRYKITVNVQTPQGLKSGYAVREIVINTFNGYNPDKADFNADIKGEAVVVDLGERQLFGLLDWDSYNEVFYAFPSPGAPISEEGIEFYKALPAGSKVELTIKWAWPKMVTFLDPDDPKTVKQAFKVENDKNDRISDFEITENNLEKYFGEGVSIKSVRVEMTDEPVTEGLVDQYLPDGARKLNMSYNYFSQPNVKN